MRRLNIPHAISAIPFVLKLRRLAGCLLAAASISGAALSQTTNWYNFQTIHMFGFTGSDLNPTGAPLIMANGDIYGTTNGGYGTLWKVSAGGGFQTLLTFQDSNFDGQNPIGEVVYNPLTGFVSGTTSRGGANGHGAYWEYVGNPLQPVIVDHSFAGTPDGSLPTGGPIYHTYSDGSSVTVGTTYLGGAYNMGTIWLIYSDGVHYPTYSVLHSFGGSGDGVNPSELAFTPDYSRVVGTCYSGGVASFGMVFQCGAGPGGAGLYRDLHDFGGPGSADGFNPSCCPFVDAHGTIWGTTQSGGGWTGGDTIWSIDSTGAYKIRHWFGGTVSYGDGKAGQDGTNPSGRITQDGFGNLYGGAQAGGEYDGGIVWQFGPSGNYYDLHDFGNSVIDPYRPMGVSVGLNGALIGTCEVGGTSTVNAGSLWSIRSDVASVSVSPASIYGGTTATGTVTLVYPAPANGLTVWLTSPAGSPALHFPASVQVPGGGSSTTFPVSTVQSVDQYTRTITANVGPGSASATLSVVSAAVESVHLSAGSVYGGYSLSGTVTLVGPAPTGGEKVNLSVSNTTIASVPSTVIVPAGATTAGFALSTKPLDKATSETVSAAGGGGKAAASATVEPAAVKSIAVSSTKPLGGIAITATAQLTSPAGPSGVTLTMSAGPAGVANVPVTTFKIPAGGTSQTYQVDTHPVDSPQSSYTGASIGGTGQKATFTVEPATLSSFTVSATSVIGGTSVTGTVTLNGAAGPAPGRVVTLSSSNTSLATVPSSVTVAAGKTSVTFTITTKKPTSQGTVTIKATLGTAVSQVITVKP